MRKTWFSALSWGLVSRLTVADETRKLPCKSELYFYFLFFILFFKKKGENVVLITRIWAEL
jgi:hypothetical protein